MGVNLLHIDNGIFHVRSAARWEGVIIVSFRRVGAPICASCPRCIVRG